jgi:hypothetical protein
MSFRKKRRISQLQTEMDELQQELNMLMGIRIRKRSLRAIGPTPAGARPQGAPRCRGRIFGCLGIAAPCECVSSCGQTNRKGPAMPATLHVDTTICYKRFTSAANLDTVTLNLATPGSVVVMAAIVASVSAANFQIQRPSGTDQTDQSDGVLFARIVVCGDTEPILVHLEACEALAAGAYTWTLRILGACFIYAYWMKAREITCLPV